MSEQPSPKPISQSSATMIGYRVQARVKTFHPSQPVELADGFLSTEWRDVSFLKTNLPVGVPVGGELGAHNLISFAGAMSLAWMILAQHSHCSVECRLVSYKLITTHALFARDEGGVIEVDMLRECGLEAKVT